MKGPAETAGISRRNGGATVLGSVPASFALISGAEATSGPREKKGRFCSSRVQDGGLQCRAVSTAIGRCWALHELDRARWSHAACVFWRCLAASNTYAGQPSLVLAANKPAMM